MTVQHLKCALYISHNVLPHTDSSANFLSSLKALNFIVFLLLKFPAAPSVCSK